MRWFENSFTAHNKIFNNNPKQNTSALFTAQHLLWLIVTGGECVLTDCEPYTHTIIGIHLNNNSIICINESKSNERMVRLPCKASVEPPSSSSTVHSAVCTTAALTPRQIGNEYYTIFTLENCGVEHLWPRQVHNSQFTIPFWEIGHRLGLAVANDHQIAAS